VILQALGKTAIKWLLIAVAFIALLSAVNFGLSFVPFTPQWEGRQLSKKVGELKSEVLTLERQAAGQAEISTATETFHTRETIIREIASQAETEARDAPDATTPLSQERADRLRLNDQRVCLSAPAICADPDPAAGRAPAVPPAVAAG
jgi:hypothetical protein